MAKGQIFEYGVLFHPKAKDGDKEGGALKSELLVDVKRVIAGSEEEVAAIAVRELPAEYMDKFDQVDIQIRPF